MSMVDGDNPAVQSGVVAPPETPVGPVTSTFVPDPGDNPRVRGEVGGGPGPVGGRTVVRVEYLGTGRGRIKRTYFSDDTFSDEAAPVESDEAMLRGEAARQRRQNAFSTIQAILATYGLADLAQYTWEEIIVKETVNLENPDAIIFALRGQDAYKKRFAANARRAAAGLPELDPASYIQLEEQYRNILRSNGLPLGFYDQLEDFQQFLENDVSPVELNERVQQGYRTVSDADPEVKRQMQQLYGVTEGELVAYFLDPQRTTPLLTRQARAAQIAARGREQAGIQLTGELAEDLARRGVTQQEAERGFGEIGALGELRQQFAGEEAISEQELVGQQFGVDIAARERLQRRQRQRVAAFEGGGTFASTTGATSFARETGVGRAQ